MLRDAQLLGREQKMERLGLREFFQSQRSLIHFLNRRRARQQVLRKYSDTGERILLKKYRKLWPQGQGRPPGAWSFLTG
jgi:hypothetical protein